MSTGNQQSVGAGDAEITGQVRAHLIELVEPYLDEAADAYASAEDEYHSFVLAAWRPDDAVVRSVRFACRLHDEAVFQVGVRNTHHINESVETSTWARQFLDGREERAVTVARARIEWEVQPARKPFDGPFFGADF